MDRLNTKLKTKPNTFPTLVHWPFMIMEACSTGGPTSHTCSTPKLRYRNGKSSPARTAIFRFLFGIVKDTDGPARWISLIHDAELVIRLSNAGIDGMNRWSFINRGDLDGHWEMINTWDAKNHRLADNITPHQNSYFVYGLISRFTAKYSDVLKTNVSGGTDTKTFQNSEGKPQPLQRVFAATFRSPKTKTISLFIVNDSETVREARIDLSSLPEGKWYIYTLDQSAKDRSDLKLEAVSAFSEKETKLTLKPLSLVLISGYELKAGDKGITID
jgi:hypothetical protein